MGGGAGEVHKKIFEQGKIKWKKNSCTAINPKKYSCYGLKKNLYKEFDKEKKFLHLENSPPPAPITFLMVLDKNWVHYLNPLNFR